MLEDLEDLEKQTPDIGANAKYWFVRTDGGELYPAFIATNSIAIGYPLVGIGVVLKLDASDRKEALKNELKRQYPPVEGADGKIADLSGLHASQLLRFCLEIKRGDVVLIPSFRTAQLSIGIVDDEGPYEEVLRHDGKVYPEYVKRRKVRWARVVDRANVNPNLFKLFLNQQTISDASPYSGWIDSLLYEFFSKGGAFHYVLKVRSNENIRAQALFLACLDLFDLSDRFARTQGLDLDFGAIETRINLNSPGDVELWKAGAEAIAFIALMVVGINGGGFEVNVKQWNFKLSLKTEGLLTKLSAFLNDHQNRKTVEEVRKKLGDLHVETPSQMIDLLKATKK